MIVEEEKVGAQKFDEIFESMHGRKLIPLLLYQTQGPVCLT